MKKLSNAILESPLKSVPGIKIQQNIEDKSRKVTDYHYCRSQPKKRSQPKLYGLSKNALNLLGIDHQETKKDQLTAEYLSGSKLLQGSEPLTHNYCGYQFGVWAGQLGDGRAHTLGSISHEGKQFQIQLKGSGVTPFSRFADGNSVVSSAVRQFLASELMAGLRIPTTRAASLVIANQDIKRDPFYNGRIRIQKAAIVTRLSQTFLRFGSLEVVLPQGNMTKPNFLENRKILEPLCDYAIAHHFPDVDIYSVDPYEELYKRLVKASAELVALWQSVGYVHGVLNTDNMSLGGLTIDYGPFGFIDYFSKDFVSNATDEHQRYSFRRQPYVVQWNLERLAEAMDPLFPYDIAMKYLKENYFSFFKAKYYETMSAKLGIKNHQKNQKLIQNMIDNMHICGTHFTNFFRIIQENSVNPKSQEELIKEIVGQSEPTQFYLENLRAFPQFLKADVNDILKQDPGFNPFFITEQPQRLKRKQTLAHQHCKDRYLFQFKIWEDWVGQYCGMRAESKELVIKNPKYCLLNYIAKDIQKQIKDMSSQESIEHFDKILQVLANPFDKNSWFQEKYWTKAPIPVKLTCSS